MSQPEQLGLIAERVVPVRIVIPGQPASYQRKTGVWHSKDGRSGVNAYASKSYQDWKSYARGRAAEVCEGRKLWVEEGVVVWIHAYFQIPVSFSRKKALAAEQGIIRPTRKPDFDNTGKAIADSCLTGIVIRDDAQIVSGHIEKWWSNEPRVEIEISVWIGR